MKLDLFFKFTSNVVLGLDNMHAGMGCRVRILSVFVHMNTKLFLRCVSGSAVSSRSFNSGYCTVFYILQRSVKVVSMRVHRTSNTNYYLDED